MLDGDRGLISNLEKQEIYGELKLKENDFKLLTDKLMTVAAAHCDNRILSMLEGGYDIQALEQSMITHLKELQK